MSELTIIEREDTALGEYIEAASRYDGSRTPPHKQAIAHLLASQGKTPADIKRATGMDERLIKAILERKDFLVSDAKALLQAHALGFAGDAIEASKEAAKRGKLADILAVTDRLGITEPPKSGAQVQVNTQVILHGGSVPGELSRAKVVETSEGPQNQAQTSDGLIMPLKSTVANSPQVLNGQALTPECITPAPVMATAPSGVDAGDATFVADVRIQA